MSISSPLSIQPIPYQGSKRSLSPTICEYFPPKIDILYEPFAGSAAISLYAASKGLANNFVIGDVYEPLMNIWEMIIHQPASLARGYRLIWNEQFKEPSTHFKKIKELYNETFDPVLLLYLIARCVKNAIRFNRLGYFTQSCDKRRTGMKPDRLERTIYATNKLLRGRVKIFKGDFQDCIKSANHNDLIYMDPPYHGTTYGKDKRYASGLKREILIENLMNLNANGIPFVLSYDGRTGDKVYSTPLPSSINAHHLEIYAGRSAQATISGYAKNTYESLYVSNLIRNDFKNSCYHEQQLTFLKSA